MNIKLVVPAALILSVLTMPAVAQTYSRPVTGAQMTDQPSQRSNVTTTGSFLRKEHGTRDRAYYRNHGNAYEQGYRDGYRDRAYDDR